MRSLRRTIGQIAKYPSAVAGLMMIGALVAIAVYALITMSPSEATRLWRGAGEVWIENPMTAAPRWVNFFPGVNLPETIIVDSREAGAKSILPIREGISEVEIVLSFVYAYDDFPQELTLFFDAEFDRLVPWVYLTWLTPDGREISLGRRKADAPHRISLDAGLRRRLGDQAPEVGLFQNPDVEEMLALRGRYELRIEGLLFEEGADLDARLVVYGQVHGLAGTDHLRRDLIIALLLGTPIALAFGFMAAVGATMSTFVLAAIGVWYGRWVDALFRWLTQVNVILPVLGILIMVGTFFSRSIWVMLGLVIVFNVFSSSLFVFRSMFLQIKESAYIEAASAYGAGNFRIIFRYMLPKVVPILLPTFVILIPSFVFLEATLAVLGLGDPHLPTWGKVLHDAQANGALFLGQYYWVLAPSVLLMLTGFGFALIGYTLDRVFNPRLRQI